MDREQARAIEWDCAKLVHEFYCALDDQRYSDLANLFAPKGIWNRLGIDLTGPDEILRAMTGRADWVTAHLVSNLRVKVLDEDHAETAQYITLYRIEGVDPAKGPPDVVLPIGVLRHWDQHVRVAGEWKIARKTSRAILINRASTTKYDKES